MDSEKQKIDEMGFRKLEELTSVGKEVTAELLLESLAHPYQWIRLEAISRVSNYCQNDFTWIFGVALNDKYDGVVDEAAQALAKINSDEALKILSNAFFAGTIERPHHIANAISKFGQRGNEVLSKGIKSSSPNIRYYSARFFGLEDDEEAKRILEEMELNDNAKTTFSGLVSTAARKRLKTLAKIEERKRNQS